MSTLGQKPSFGRILQDLCKADVGASAIRPPYVMPPVDAGTFATFPTAIAVDASGHFVYVTNGGVLVYTIKVPEIFLVQL